MTEHVSILANLFADCWKDEALKQRFLTDPKSVLAERNLAVPDGIDVRVLENSSSTVHITIPRNPAGEQELSDEDLANVAGGGNTPDWNNSKHMCTSWKCPCSNA